MTGDLEAVLDDVRTALADAAGHVDGICRAVEVALADTGADVTGLRRSFGAVSTQLNALILAAGDPEALRTTGARWIGDVAGPVSRLVGVFTDDVLETDDHWTGVAADAYRATLLPQQKALAAVVATCGEVDADLEDLAAAITRFWIAIGSACLGLVLALAGALGTAATVVGVPASAGIALAGVGALVVAGNAALSSLIEVTGATTARGAALGRLLADSSAFPLGHWPRSTTGGGPDAAAPGGDAHGWAVR